MPSTRDFEDAIAGLIERATKQKRAHVEINAGEVHRTLGSYPPNDGETHNMPSCCNAMRAEMNKGSAEIVYETDSAIPHL